MLVETAFDKTCIFDKIKLMGVDLGIEGNFFEQHRRFCHSIAGTQEVFEKLSILFQEDKQYFLV